MLLGEVKGTAVCTQKYAGMEGIKLLVVQPLDKHLLPQGSLQVAADVVQAGPGDLWAMPEIKFVPVDLALVGIVDELNVRPDGEFDVKLKSGWNQLT